MYFLLYFGGHQEKPSSATLIGPCGKEFLQRTCTFFPPKPTTPTTTIVHAKVLSLAGLYPQAQIPVAVRDGRFQTPDSVDEPENRPCGGDLCSANLAAPVYRQGSQPSAIPQLRGGPAPRGKEETWSEEEERPRGGRCRL